ncbi:uncharacterized protein LOC111389184 isoform X2 [Olea europaea var. sylvestris]|uniref:uncharacterized protein LOC111389184 isoform X2 n=1 Tax=Olea europaea var. sylvestris TaxID=158386 RepID=UPI000C1D27AB|nr:uncharacterized protein LOC111389184 isoform X2 [Olea europaea var. sylvestris]
MLLPAQASLCIPLSYPDRSPVQINTIFCFTFLVEKIDHFLPAGECDGDWKLSNFDVSSEENEVGLERTVRNFGCYLNVGRLLVFFSGKIPRESWAYGEEREFSMYSLLILLQQILHMIIKLLTDEVGIFCGNICIQIFKRLFPS